MERVFVDTSAWFALTNRADAQHIAVSQYLAAFHGRLVTSNFVFDEVVTLSRSRLDHAAAATLGGHLLTQRNVDIVRVTAEDEQVAWRLFLDRPDKDYSFTDCTSFVLMRRLGLRHVVATDADFQREGFDVVPGG
jgi:uncharacterized protein